MDTELPVSLLVVGYDRDQRANRLKQFASDLATKIDAGSSSSSAAVGLASYGGVGSIKSKSGGYPDLQKLWNDTKPL